MVFIFFLEAGHILVTIPCYINTRSKNTYQYFIHNTRGLPGGSPHSLVSNGSSEEGRSFFELFLDTCALEMLTEKSSFSHFISE